MNSCNNLGVNVKSLYPWELQLFFLYAKIEKSFEDIIGLSLDEIRQIRETLKKVRDGEISQAQIQAMAGGCEPLSLLIISFLGGLVIGGGGLSLFATGFSW